MKNILEQLTGGKVLLSDAAMGTYLQKQGMQSGECPESWCISHPEKVRTIAEACVAAGSQIVETNSFGANALKLKPYGLSDRVNEFNRAAVSLARAAAGSENFVAASVGPTGRILQEEGGDVDKAEMYDAFKEQIAALAASGADAICIETMSSVQEAVQAIRAVRENTSLPVICTFTFQAGPKGFRTMMGITPEHAARAAARAGADIVGANCGDGIVNMIKICQQMRSAEPQVLLMIQPNAGVPRFEDGKTIFDDTPQLMASHVGELLRAGANIIGGCCGTTPLHIAAMKSALGSNSSRS